MKYFFILGLLGLFIVSSADFFPDQDSVYINGQEYRPVHNDYNPMPAYRDNQRDSNQYSTPQENCWYEQVAIPSSSVNESPNMYGTIVGGVIGGVIGHQFGSGSGKAAATIGGAALGTALGSTPQSQVQRYQTVRKCNTAR